MGAVEATTRHLQDVGLFVDAADGALARTEGLLTSGRDRITSGAGGMDDILTSIDQEVSSPRFGGEAALSMGVTIRAGAAAFDIPPVSTSDLGAVIDGGRSHRLADLRSGGSLDAAAFPGGAIRSIDAAAIEVRSARTGLAAFRSGALEPAQRAALSAMADTMATGPLSSGDVESLARRVRTGLSRGEALLGTNAPNVLALLA